MNAPMKSTMALLHILQSQNNYAAQLMASKDYPRAFRVLLQAIELHKTISTQAKEIAGPNDKNFILSVKALHSQEYSRDDETAMFTWPLLLVLSNSEPRFHETSGQDDIMSGVLATLFYNMGLLYHHNSLDVHLTTLEREKLQLQTQAIYWKSYTLCSGMPNLALLGLALTNNLLELAFEAIDEEGFEYWHHHFTQYIVRVPPKLFSECLVLHFSRVLLYYSPGLVAAPAA